MYGPWFWPPASPPFGPIANPYYTSDLTICDPDPTAQGWCQPPLIPGTPNLSVGQEAFNDTPIVNGTAYPTMTVDPKEYRFRILNAANDRFWNLQWYVADPSGKEVAFKAAELARLHSLIRISYPHRIRSSAPQVRPGCKLAPRAASCRLRWSFRTR